MLHWDTLGSVVGCADPVSPVLGLIADHPDGRLLSPLLANCGQHAPNGTDQ